MPQQPKKDAAHMMLGAKINGEYRDVMIDGRHIAWPITHLADPSDPTIKATVELHRPGGQADMLLSVTPIPGLVERARAVGIPAVTLRTSGGFYMGDHADYFDLVTQHVDPSDVTIKSVIERVAPGGNRTTLTSMDTVEDIYHACLGYT